MKFSSISFPLLLASAAAATSSINTEFDEQVHKTQAQLQLRGNLNGRSQEWLDASQSFVGSSLQWSHGLKQKAAEYAAQGAANGCVLPTGQLDPTVANKLVGANGNGIGLSALPATSAIYQQWESRGSLSGASAMTKVGCGDAINKASTSNNNFGCYVSVCLYSK